MRNIPSEAAFETVTRDVAVTADGKTHHSSKTNTRLGYNLQRLFEPVTNEQPDQLDHLLRLLDQGVSQSRHF
jgi:hypothetical protein